jgi:hypothetical protein
MIGLFPACLLLALSLPASPALAGSAPSPGGRATKNEAVCQSLTPPARPTGDTTKTAARPPATRPHAAIATAHLHSLSTLVEMPALGQPAAEAVAPVETTEVSSETEALSNTFRRPEAPLGRRVYRTRLVRTGHWASKPEAVEILTCTYAGPLVLALLPATPTTPSQVLAGPGYDATTPLRPLALTQEAVLRLCGDRAPQVRAYAMRYDLHFQQADEVARLLDYYNRIAVVK